MIHQITTKDGLSPAGYSSSKHYFWRTDNKFNYIRCLGWCSHGMGQGVSHRYGCGMTYYIQEAHALSRNNETSYE
jgi:hypothetical protein